MKYMDCYFWCTIDDPDCVTTLDLAMVVRVLLLLLLLHRVRELRM
jgi:hypothetical protein